LARRGGQRKENKNSTGDPDPPRAEKGKGRMYVANHSQKMFYGTFRKENEEKKTRLRRTAHFESRQQTIQGTGLK